jgi:hypothetical protein
LTAEQARILQETALELEVRDEAGSVLGRIPAPSETEIIARIKRSREHRDPNAPRSSSQEVLTRLHTLEDIRSREELDEPKVRELLRRMRAGEKV